jgi:ADP-ribose pyrophosphatase YjhB (NUDIX family)
MSRIYPNHPGFGVGAVVFVDDRLLLIRRGNPPNEGSWIFPGGLVEIGESIEDALIREVEEETGLTVRVGKLIELFDYIDLDEHGRVRYHYIIADYSCELVEGELEAGSDVTDVRWIRLDELPSLELSVKALEVIEKARKLIGRGEIQKVGDIHG